MKEFTQNQGEVAAAIPENVKNIPDIKKYYWLNYCERILIGGVFDVDNLAYDGLVSTLVDIIFEDDIARLEIDIRSKSTEIQKLYHFNSETGKIEEYFKPILKACYLQDVLFQIFSITENDVQGFNFEEDKLKNLDFKLPESFKIVMLDFLNTQNKTEFRLQKLDNIISNPNTKVTIKTFDEHSNPNEQHDKNFHPEEQRSLGYSKSFVNCLTKIKEEIETKQNELLNKFCDIKDNIANINAAQKKLKIEANECRRIMVDDASGKVKVLKDELIKLWNCLESLDKENDEPLPFVIKIKFKETSNNQEKLLQYDPYKPNYIIKIKYIGNDKSIDVSQNTNVNAENENNNLNSGNDNNIATDDMMNFDELSLENLQQCRNNSLQIVSECITKLDSLEYDLVVKYLKESHTLRTYTDLKIDFPKHFDEETCKQINEMVRLELKACVHRIKAKIYRNKIDQIQAKDIRKKAMSKLRNFEHENQETKSQLENEKNQAINKYKLLKHIGRKFQNIEIISDLESTVSNQYDAVLARNLIYFDDDLIKVLRNYVDNRFPNFGVSDYGLKEYCHHVKYYYKRINQPLDSKTINNLCSGLMKLPRFNGDKNKVIEFCEDAMFIDSDIEEIEDNCIFKIELAALGMLYVLITFVLFSLYHLISAMVAVGFFSVASLFFAGYILYHFLKNRQEISKYWAYKKEYNHRLKYFYNFDDQNNIGQTRKDFEQNVEEQKYDLELKMGIVSIANENQAEQKEIQKENPDQNIDIQSVPKKMETMDLEEQKQK